ncbi:MAG: O-antigen ligase family protein, partial [Bacteroides sp.]|nr:O-antigen ligase family protein [Bacteroides sp.]
YLRNPSPEGYVALLTLLSIGVFSFFSYPFTYPFTWIVVGWCMFVLIVKGYKKIKSQKTLTREY